MKLYISTASYLLAMSGTIALWNADTDAAWSWVGLGIWACASVLLGAVTGRTGCFLLAFVAILIAVPFGVRDNDFRWSETFPLWVPVAANSFIAAGLIAVGALARKPSRGGTPRRRAAIRICGRSTGSESPERVRRRRAAGRQAPAR
jgi:hypothetical protein